MENMDRTLNLAMAMNLATAMNLTRNDEKHGYVAGCHFALSELLACGLHVGWMSDMMAGGATSSVKNDV